MSTNFRKKEKFFSTAQAARMGKADAALPHRLNFVFNIPSRAG
jgi:hypothetical protein